MAKVLRLRNIGKFTELVDRVVHRPSHLPGMAVFYGPSGFGKTYSACFAANTHQAYHVEVGSVWTRRKLVQEILKAVGGTSFKATIADMMDAVIERLELSPHPLIIDEADYLVQKKYTDLVREIHDKSKAPVILIGEELLPHKLQEFERTHNRVMNWVSADPIDLEDITALVALHLEGIEIDQGMLTKIEQASHGIIRRVCVNLERIREQYHLEGWKKVTTDHWGERAFFTGDPPRRRKF